MAESQKCTVDLGGTKRKPKQNPSSFDEPFTKTKRQRGESVKYDFEIGQAEQQNGKRYSDGNDDLWDEELHSHFVSSIFEIGLKNSSPAVILENMTQKVETINSERVKSKLQKYRSNKNKEKSKAEFMTNYSDFLDRIKSIQAAARPLSQGITDSSSSDPVLLQLIKDNTCNTSDSNQQLLGGDAAAYLTYAVMNENNQTKNARRESSLDGTTNNGALPTNVLRKGSRDYVDQFSGCAIQFPVLTEIEKKSSLGIAMTFIAGLFLTMSQHLKRERARAETIGLKLSPPTTINNGTDRVDRTTT